MYKKKRHQYRTSKVTAHLPLLWLRAGGVTGRRVEAAMVAPRRRRWSAAEQNYSSFHRPWRPLEGLLPFSLLLLKKKSFRSMREPTTLPSPPPRLPRRRRRHDKKAQFYYVGVSIIKWLSPTLKKSCRIMLLYTSCSFTVEWPRANASAASTPPPPLSPSP